MLTSLLLLPFLATPQEPISPELLETVGKKAVTSAEISADDLRLHIGYLASDELEGRGSGRRGGALAAEYFVSQWKRLGLKPGNGKSYLHEFEVNDREKGKRIKLTCRNTCAILPGTDPKMKDKYLVIGGHHDHAGLGEPMTGGMGAYGEIHNGADDNASGSSGVLELAEYFTAHPLKHPILFLSFSAEERGLLGSKAFVKDKVINPKKMLAMINLDMIGRMRDDYLFVGGMGTAKEFHEILDPVFAKSSLNLDLSDKGEAPSDNTSFYHGGVPALFFFTDIHDDYHMPGDDADGILYDEEVQILNIVKDCAIALDQVKKLKFTSNDGMGMPPDFMERNMMHFQHAMERKQKLGKLGVTPEEGKEVIKAKKVREDSAADQAGLKAGDKLLSIEGRAMVTILDMRRALGGKMKGETVEVVYSRSGKSHTATITLQ